MKTKMIFFTFFLVFIGLDLDIFAINSNLILPLGLNFNMTKEQAESALNTKLDKSFAKGWNLDWYDYFKPDRAYTLGFFKNRLIRIFVEYDLREDLLDAFEILSKSIVFYDITPWGNTTQVYGALDPKFSIEIVYGYSKVIDYVFIPKKEMYSKYPSEYMKAVTRIQTIIKEEINRQESENLRKRQQWETKDY